MFHNYLTSKPRCYVLQHTAEIDTYYFSSLWKSILLQTLSRNHSLTNCPKCRRSWFGFYFRVKTHDTQFAVCSDMFWFTVVDNYRASFYPRPVLAFGYCRCLRLCVCLCVCVCVNHLLVRAITRDSFKLGSPNLNQRCKRPRLRPLLFCGLIDHDLQGQI